MIKSIQSLRKIGTLTTFWFNLSKSDSTQKALRRGICGFFVVVKKSSNDNYFHYKWVCMYWKNIDFALVKTSSFWIKEVVIWWLFDETWEREVESQKKPQTAATRKSCWNILFSQFEAPLFECVLISFKLLFLLLCTLKLQEILKSCLNSQINTDYEKNTYFEVFKSPLSTLRPPL